MRNLILFGLLIIMLLAAQFTSAKTVEEVIDKYMRARGGKDRLLSIKSIYLEGIREMTGGDVSVKIIKEQDKLSRTDIDDGTTQSYVLITDKAAWSFFPNSASANNLLKNLDALQTETDIAGPLADYLAKGHKAELLGKDLVEGNGCYKIRLTTNTGNVIFFWLDRSTFLLQQSSSADVDNENVNRQILTIYRNYKAVDGILFAHTCETKIAGTNEVLAGGEIIFHNIILNPVIDPKSFLPEQSS